MIAGQALVVFAEIVVPVVIRRMVSIIVGQLDGDMPSLPETEHEAARSPEHQGKARSDTNKRL